MYWRGGEVETLGSAKPRLRGFDSLPRLTMSKEGESGFRKETGKWVIAGGVIAGIIGLVTNPNLAIAAAGLIIGGWILRKD